MSAQPAQPRNLADPGRIAACLKACEGVPTEKLEGDIWLRLVAACVHVDDDEVRSRSSRSCLRSGRGL